MTLCVILRKLVNGRILFAQFVGRCKRMHLDLRGNVPDRTESLIYSYPEFGQQKLWNEMNRISEHDPVDVDDDNE